MHRSYDSRDRETSEPVPRYSLSSKTRGVSAGVTTKPLARCMRTGATCSR
jgi:hypothetical protein